MNNIKLAHFISQCGITSRRKAESLILSGRIRVNNIIETNVASRIKDTDDIFLDGNKIQLVKSRLFILNKPIKYLVSHARDDNKSNIFDLININIHLIYVGRLDYMSQGLLLLTNQPSMADKLMNNPFPRRYLVEVDYIHDQFTRFLANPIIDGYKLRSIKLNDIKIDRFNEKYEIDLTLFEGKNREIRRICEKFKMRIFRLERIEYGPFKCDIPIGEFKELFDWKI